LGGVLDCLADLVHGHVGVDLGGSDALVAQGVLRDAQVADPVQAGGEGVSQRVRRDVAVDGGKADLLDESLDGADACRRASVAGGEEVVFIVHVVCV